MGVGADEGVGDGTSPNAGGGGDVSVGDGEADVTVGVGVGELEGAWWGGAGLGVGGAHGDDVDAGSFDGDDVGGVVRGGGGWGGCVVVEGGCEGACLVPPGGDESLVSVWGLRAVANGVDVRVGDGGVGGGDEDTVVGSDPGSVGQRCGRGRSGSEDEKASGDGGAVSEGKPGDCVVVGGDTSCWGTRVNGDPRSVSMVAAIALAVESSWVFMRVRGWTRVTSSPRLVSAAAASIPRTPPPRTTALVVLNVAAMMSRASSMVRRT